jgi:hypothetical protein
MLRGSRLPATPRHRRPDGKLCKALIQCEIDRGSTVIQQIFARKLVKAGAKQSELGNKAVWRQTNYGDNAVEGEGASDGII